MKAQNTLFILTDSMDGRVMGQMGHPAVRHATPNLDALAERGTLFTNAYTMNPLCCPARAAMWSGLYTHHCEAWNNYKGLEKGDRTFQHALEESGRRFQALGKLDYLSGAHSVRARVSAWTRSASIPRPCYNEAGPRLIEEPVERVRPHDWPVVDNTVAWLREAAQRPGEPFTLYVGLRCPHPPFRTSRRWLDCIPPEAVDLPAFDETTHPALLYQRMCKNWTHGFDPEMVHTVRRTYFAMIAELDAMVGTILRTLEQEGLSDATNVIFSSDHGECAMEHQQFYKSNHYEASAHIPMIMAGPDIRRAARVETPVSLIDIYPTLMDLAGLPTPAGLDGHSLMPMASGGARGSHPDWAFGEYHDTSCNTGSYMLRRGDWKYIAYAGMPSLLFDLRHDPHELRDATATRPEVAGEMDALLRSIVNCEAVDTKVKAYDRASFARWREEEKAAGTYEATMALIFSGYDHLSPEDCRPWTAEDEARIVEWLRQG